MVRIFYILILIAAALFYPLYEDKLSFILLVSLIILPVLLLIQMIISAVFLKCSPKRRSVTMIKGSEGEIGLRITNNSVFPLTSCCICVRADFAPSGETAYYKARIPLPALSSQTVNINMTGKHCGTAQVKLEYIKIHDLLHLFSLKALRKNDVSTAAYIIPKINEKHRELAMELLNAPPPSDCREETELLKSSPEPGDVCGFREFAPGDRLSMIHYKLSARFDSDIVKILSAAGGSRFLLTADLSDAAVRGEDGNYDLDMRDILLEKLLSCAFFLMENGAEVFAAVPSGSPCTTIPLEFGEAAVFEDRESYFSAAKALAASVHCGAVFEKGFILCPITAEFSVSDEIT